MLTGFKCPIVPYFLPIFVDKTEPIMNNKYLPVGFVLHSPQADYTIVKVLGSGGFGITYLAATTLRLGNITTEVKVAIKEHFLSDDCERSATSEVSYSKPAAERVRNSKSDFTAEARRLHKVGVDHPNVVKVNEVFEANNTAYYVMEYLDGQSLRAYVDARGRLSAAEALQLLRPVIEAAGFLHDNRITHLDIKPDNIMLREKPGGKPEAVLIDFGLSKHYNEDSTPTSTINTMGYSEGYSPIEQYAGIRTFSPVSDIYSLGATLYYTLTGKVPPAATEVEIASLRNQLLKVTSAHMADAVCAAMQMRGKDRPADCRRWLDIIDGNATVTVDDSATRTISKVSTVVTDPEETVTPDYNRSDETVTLTPEPVAEPYSYNDDDQESEPRRNLTWLWVLLALLVAGGAGWAYYQFVYLPGEKKVAANSDTEQNYTVNSDGTFNPDANEVSAGSQDLIEREIEEAEQLTELTIVPDEIVVAENVVEEIPAPEQGVDDISANAVRETVVVEEKPKTEPASNQVFNLGTVEQKPAFPGGDAALFKWLSEHLNYPPAAAEDGVSGRVIVQFVVKKDGQIDDVKVVRGKHPALDKEAVRVVRCMPKWIPGTQNGVPVNVTYSLPIAFKLTQ